MSTKSEERAREMGYEEGRKGEPPSPRNGLFDKLVDPKGSKAEDDAYRRGYDNGRIDRQQGR